MSRPIRGIRAELDGLRSRVHAAETEIRSVSSRLGIDQLRAKVSELEEELRLAERAAQAARFSDLPRLPPGWHWIAPGCAEGPSGRVVYSENGAVTFENSDGEIVSAESDVVRAVMMCEELDR